MTIISIFRTDGSKSSNPTAASDYLYGPLSALTDEQKMAYRSGVDLLALAKQSADVQLEYEARLMLNQKGKLRTPAPQALTNNREQVDFAIANNPHAHKYTSGVIAHAQEDAQKLIDNPHIEREWRELLEDLFFAGLPEEERLIAWVRHSHQPILENHFLVPRIHLATGKYFNPTPPHCEADLNAVRDYLNLKYDLVNPMDPLRRRVTVTPRIFDTNREFKKHVNDWVDKLIMSESLQNRDQLITLLRREDIQNELGIKGIKVSQKYLSLTPNGKEKAVRFKGFAYSSDFTSYEQLLASPEVNTKSKEERLKELKDKLDAAIDERAKSNTTRYQPKSSEPMMTAEPKIQLDLPEPTDQVQNEPKPDLIEENIQSITEKINQRLVAIEPFINQNSDNNNNKEKSHDTVTRSDESLPHRTQQKLPKLDKAIPDRITATIDELREKYQGVAGTESSQSPITIAELRNENNSADISVSTRADRDPGKTTESAWDIDTRIPSLSQRVNETIERCRASISFSRIIDSEITEQIDYVRKFVLRIEQISLNVMRRTSELIVKPELWEKFKGVLKAQRKQKDIHKPLTMDDVINQMEGQRPSRYTGMDIKKEKLRIPAIPDTGSGLTGHQLSLAFL